MPGPAQSRTRPRIGAFFDMDKTLIAENSGSLWMKHRYENGEIGNLDLLKGIAVYLQYKLGVLDIRSWAQTALADYRGKREDEMEKVAREWFDTAIAPALYPEAAALVREHEAAGHVIAIVSGATRYVVQPLASGSASATCSTRDSRSSAAASRAA
jgi:phosphoserine phosphatase